jgi:ring-1,2-phenylacetyl-CoA epoxidase subunit PaaC
MNPELRRNLSVKLTCMADDELILGQRDSEWCGHAPILEEDIAFANIALDEIGHAGLWYGVLADLVGEERDTYPDALIYRRTAGDFRNSMLVELPVGDWAFTIVRQYLFDSYESRMLPALARCGYIPLAEVAAKVQKEEVYHLRHSSAWLRRLGLGTHESNRRMQKALDELWPYSGQLFLPVEGEETLVDSGFVPQMDEVESVWLTDVKKGLSDAGLVVPPEWKSNPPRRITHTVHHKPMILELQSVVRQHPDADW